ncbi:MAG: cytochrome c [Acidobacteriia bacterium]|nr:cytochrome c [Terriglobia bacterium]
MRRRRLLPMAGAAALLLVAAAATALPSIRLYWRHASANPVRRGAELARQLGCFSCHGDLGGSGIPEPGADDRQVPAWSGGLWMMYVKDREEVREFILDGVSRRRAASASARDKRVGAGIRMPAYRRLLRAGQVDDLVAAFEVLSGMKGPPDGTPEERGRDIARTRRCFSCHGPAGSGGLPNPGSFTGFVPGWYGADFADLVRSPGEFETWIRTGGLPRLSSSPVASVFLERQRLGMPSYRALPATDVDDLWAYVSWLARTRGGLEAPDRPF